MHVLKQILMNVKIGTVAVNKSVPMNMDTTIVLVMKDMNLPMISINA